MQKIKIFLEGGSLFDDLLIRNPNFECVSKEDCYFIVSNKFEAGMYDNNKIQRNITLYKNEGKKVLVFLLSDTSATFDLPKNMLLIRSSLKNSKKRKQELLMPYIWECFNDEIIALNKSKLPIVGFCGNTRNNIGKRLSTIKTIEKNKNIQSNFIVRNGFWGGKPNDTSFFTEFKENIIQSHFTICNKGRGNFTMRFYQVLSLGRIPVLIDSDMVFPFHNQIDWEKYIITAKSEKHLSQKIEKWWATKTENEVIETQIACKKLYDTYFSQNNYCTNLASLLNNLDDNIFVNESKMDFYLNKLIGYFKNL